MRSNSRTEILDHALDVLRAGNSLTLESAALQSGLTKPGLMYHFGTKEALMLALVDHVVDRYEAELTAVAGGGLSALSPTERVLAYLRWSLEGGFDASDLVMVADPRLRGSMIERWNQRIDPWIAVPVDLPVIERARLSTVRLIADGSWFSESAGATPLPDDERDQVYRTACEILGVA